MKTKQQFHRWAQILLVYTLIVILWGAWVRISHSGDGCGDTWPLCNGKLIPEAQQNKTWVEYSHRLTSGFFGIFVVFLYFIGRRLFAKTDPVRKALLATLIFTITEALLGAKLVLFGLVGSNDSPFRLTVMGLHQVNSLLLTGSVALVVLFASGLPEKVKNLQLGHKSKTLPRGAIGFLILFIVVSVTGAFAALSTTLFPTVNLWQGLNQDFAPDAHYLLRLRISHPILATLIGGGLALYFWLRSLDEINPLLRKATLQVALILILGVVFGYITLFSLAPLWMKVTHLLIAHLVWIALLRWYMLKSSAH